MCTFFDLQDFFLSSSILHALEMMCTNQGAGCLGMIAPS